MSKTNKKTNVPPQIEEIEVQLNVKEIQKKKREDVERKERIETIEEREKWIQEFTIGLSEEVKILKLQQEIDKAKIRLNEFLANDVYNRKLKIQLEGETIEMLKEMIEDLKSETVSSKKSLTEQLLIIHFLQKENLFPKHNTKSGETQKQNETFIANLLGQNFETVKKRFQDVKNIVENKGTTTGNRSIRIKYLENVEIQFRSIGRTEIADRVKNTLKKVKEHE